MGAGVILLAAAAQRRRSMEIAARRRERERRERLERERKAREKRDQERRSSYKSSSSYDNSYLKCLSIEMENDPELKDFFDRLGVKVEEVRVESGKEKEKQVADLIEVVKKYQEKKVELEEQLKEAGIELGNLGRGYCYCKSPMSSQEVEYESISRYYLFNGLTLSIRNVRDPEDKQFETNYESAKRICEEGLPEYIENQKQVRRKVALNKIPLIRSYDREKDVETLQYNIERYERDMKAEEEAKVNLEKFRALTPEQKKLIGDYLEVCGSIEKGCLAISEARRTYSYTLPQRSDKQVIEEAIAKMEKEGLTEEQIMAIFQKLDRVAIRRNRGEYDALNSRRYSTDEVVRGFVTHVYEEDPEFVDRNFDEVLDEMDELREEREDR